MTKQEKALLNQLNGVYNLKRFDEMGKLQNSLVKIISRAKLPIQDVLMVLTVLSRQLEGTFLKKLYPKEEKTSGSNVEKTSV